MQFIKTYWEISGNFTVSVRTNCYNGSLAHIQKMLAVLIKDHPSQKIDAENIAIVIYNTDSYKGIMGIEFQTKNPNKAYFRLNVAPYIF